jgi:hypothetical protein
MEKTKTKRLVFSLPWVSSTLCRRSYERTPSLKGHFVGAPRHHVVRRTCSKRPRRAAAWKMHGTSRSRLVGLIRAVPYIQGATVERYVTYHNKYTYKTGETMASRQDSSQCVNTAMHLGVEVCPEPTVTM